MKVFKSYPLGPHHTFGLDVRSKYGIEVEHEDEVPRAIETADELGAGTFMFLGGGSNVLFAEDYPGTVIRLNFGEIVHRDLGNGKVWVEAGAGVSWHGLVEYTVLRGWWGLENLAFIPGTVGAAPIQNIGAYGVEQGDCFDSLMGVPLNGPPSEYPKSHCAFGYRDSVFKQELKGKIVICRVRYLCTTNPNPQLDYKELKQYYQTKTGSETSSLEIASKVMEIRKAKLPDPALLGNAGSFFKNPILEAADAERLQARFPEMPLFETETASGGDKLWKGSAAWLIDYCGWKGKRRGAIGVSAGHALVLVNYGGGKGADLCELAEDISRSVRDEFGINLVPEVQIIRGPLPE